MIDPVRRTPIVLAPKTGDDSSEGAISFWMDDPPPSLDTGLSSTGGPPASASLVARYVDASGSPAAATGNFAVGA